MTMLTKNISAVFATLALSASAATAQTVWTTSSGSGLDVAYGNGKFVAVGNGGGVGEVRTSTDGTTWSTQTLNGVSWLNHVAYANGLWVATGTGGKLYTSTDASSWTLRTTGLADLTDIAYGNGRWLTTVLSSTNTFATSTDGVNWSSISGSAGTGGVAYGNGVFVTMDTSHSYTSTDGVTWTSHATAEGVGGLTFINGRFMGVGGNNRIGESLDGITWSFRDIGFATTPNIQNLGFGGGTYVAVGLYGQASGVLLTSTDGTNWTNRSAQISGNLVEVTYGDNRFVAVGAITATSLVPEPATYGAALGALALGFVAWRRRR